MAAAKWQPARDFGDRHIMRISAERKRHYRQRRARGLRVFRIEADEVALSEALVEHGLLHPADPDDPRLVEKALALVIENWLARA